MDYLIPTYREWIDNHILLDVFSANSLKTLTEHMLLGRNYRIITETNTKTKLMLTYLWLMDVVKNAQEAFGESWQELLLNDLQNAPRKTDEQKNLMLWLIGLTKKTSENLDVRSPEFPEFMQTVLLHINDFFDAIDRRADVDTAWLLMMAGSATLNIRGSEKSKIGKQLEKAFIRSCLTILGLEENRHFWLNIQRDNEVERETDVEIATPRGRVRMEVGLIGPGNQEVIEDKIGRVGRNGVVLFDKVGDNTRIYDTAVNHNVKLIQIRNNQPLLELYRHLNPLVATELTPPPKIARDIHTIVHTLPDDIFRIRG